MIGKSSPFATSLFDVGVVATCALFRFILLCAFEGDDPFAFDHAVIFDVCEEVRDDGGEEERIEFAPPDAVLKSSVSSCTVAGAYVGPCALGALEVT